jgi:hypothetical protein
VGARPRADGGDRERPPRHDGTTLRGPPHRPGTRWSFGYFGQINEHKGLDVLLRACALIAEDTALASSIQIDVNGVIPNHPATLRESLAKAEGLYPFLSCKGAYPNSSVGRLMRANDYVLMLSTWWENSPVVIQEAYGSGRPVLCPGLGGMAEKVLDGVSGLHFLPGDPVDLVRAIRGAMEAGTHDRLLSGCRSPRTRRKWRGATGTSFSRASSRPRLPYLRAKGRCFGCVRQSLTRRRAASNAGPTPYTAPRNGPPPRRRAGVGSGPPCCAGLPPT